jgi:hypothetical protein
MDCDKLEPRDPFRVVEQGIGISGGRSHQRMILTVGRKVRFYEPYRPAEVRWGMLGIVVTVEERPTPLGRESWVRARFGNFITPWIEEWQLEPV